MLKKPLAPALAQLLKKFSDEDAACIEAFCKEQEIRKEFEIREWVERKFEGYLEQDVSVLEWERGRKVYSLLLGKEYDPRSFITDAAPLSSLGVQTVWILACRHGSRAAFERYVRAGGCASTEEIYAAYRYQLIPREKYLELLNALKVTRVHKKALPLRRKRTQHKRRGP